MDAYSNKIYIDAGNINHKITPDSTDSTQDIILTFIQSQGECTANITLEPRPYSRSRIKIYIFAENTSKVNCVCTLNVPREVEGVETDVQIRSWPFDRSKISARPEMKIANSNIVATHGNALGILKPEQEYYLRSRGFNSYKELIKHSLLNNE
jgi:Fe-S cluster assembly scaffold protein SufB